MDKEETIAGTLAWCNDRRAEQGKDPLDVLPNGKRYDALSCPCGKATGLRVERDQYGPADVPYDVMYVDGSSRTDEYGLWQPVPDAVAEFVECFDLGLLPEFEETTTEGGGMQDD